MASSPRKTTKESGILPADPPCQRFCCSKFCTFEDAPLTTPADLSNEIHPIFSRSKFGKDFDYASLEMPLRLATRALESDAAVMFLNTMVDGDVYTFNYGRKRGCGDPFWRKSSWSEVDVVVNDRLHQSRIARVPKEGFGEVNDTTRRRAREILTRLANVVTEYTLQDMEDMQGCYESDQRPMTSRSSAAFPRGVTATIKLNKTTFELLKMLEDHRNDPDMQKHRRYHLLLRFKIVETLLHELGHVIAFAGSGRRSCQPYYGMKIKVVENGFEFVADIFGGTVDDKCLKSFASKHEPCSVRMEKLVGVDDVRFPIVSEWPNDATTVLYRKQGASYGTLEKEIPQPNEVRWRVPLAFIEGLFTDKYWQAEAPKRGVNALKLPNVGAWVFSDDIPCKLQDLEGEKLRNSHKRVLKEAMGIVREKHASKANVLRVEKPTKEQVVVSLPDSSEKTSLKSVIKKFAGFKI